MGKYKWWFVKEKETKTHWIIEFDYFRKKGLPHLKLKKTVGPHKDIYGTKQLWNIIKFDLKPQNNNLEKIFAIELMENVQNKRKEIRLGYYIIGKKKRFQGKWAWGQYCPFIPQEDLKELCDIIYHGGYI